MTEPNFEMLRVGELYHPNRRKWTENVEFNFRGGHYELRLFYDRPTPEEIEEVSAGGAHFILTPYGPIIFFCFRFGSQPWSDSPYTFHMVPPDQQIPPQDPENETQGAILTVILVDASTGIIKALRVIGLGHKFTLALVAAIRSQIASPFSQEDYDLQLKYIYDKYQSHELAQMGIAHYFSVHKP